jgi:hypothetical protein
MYVNIKLPISTPSGLTIPSDAVIDTGLSQHAFVQIAEGFFQARTIKTGWQLGDRVQVEEGLHEGDTVVSSGTFLVDSESKLQLSSLTANTFKQRSVGDDAKTHHGD